MSDLTPAALTAQVPQLTRISEVHGHLLTWAVHDDRVCVHLAVTEQVRRFCGVFYCRVVDKGAADPCPWLGRCRSVTCDREAAESVYDQAAASGWDDAVIYRLLEQLHAREVAR